MNNIVTPLWKLENDIAEKLGWECNKDNDRHTGDDAKWSWFLKGNQRVWCSYPVWVRATFLWKENEFRDHVRFDSLIDALMFERDDGNISGDVL